MRYLTKDWYLKCQRYPQTAALKDELKRQVSAYQDAQSKEGLPPEIRQRCMLHDGVVSKIEIGTDCTLELDSPYSDCHRIVFREALLKQEIPPVGASWLYEELYRHKSGIGYEVHILFCKRMPPRHKAVLNTDLFETKIICKDIVFEG